MNAKFTRDLFYAEGLYSDTAIHLCSTLIQEDVYHVLKMIRETRSRFKLSRDRSERLATSLLTDLVQLHGCAVSGNQASPCFVGKHIGEELDVNNDNFYVHYSMSD